MTSRSILVFACCLGVAGCGGLTYSTVPVSGRVTLDGKPLANVLVTFQTQSAGDQTSVPDSAGVTDTEGRYQLELVGQPGKKGAVPGKHFVRFDPVVQNARGELPVGQQTAAVLPPGVTQKSHTFDVPTQGTDQADFALTSK